MIAATGITVALLMGTSIAYADSTPSPSPTASAESYKERMDRFKKETDVTPQMLMQMEGMAERNAQRIEQIKQDMGDRYILHPSHNKSRLDEPRPV